MFFPKDIFRSNHRKVLYKIVVLHLWSKTLKNTFLGRLYSNTSIVTPIHHRSVTLISYVIQSCNIRAIGYEAESMSKIEFWSCRITFCGNVSCKKSSFSYGELNVVLAIQSSCGRIKLRQMASKLLPLNQISYTLLLFCRIGFYSVDLYLYLPLYWNFYYGSDNFCFSNLKISFLLVFLVFLSLIFAFLDKVLC